MFNIDNMNFFTGEIIEEDYSSSLRSYISMYKESDYVNVCVHRGTVFKHKGGRRPILTSKKANDEVRTSFMSRGAA